MKKAIFRALTNVYPKPENLEDIMRKYLDYFKEKIGLDLN